MNASLRILMLVFNAVGKGTYWRAFHLARHLVQRGHQVTLMAMSKRRRLGFRVHLDEGVTVVESPDLLWGPLRSGWDLWEASWRIQWLRGHRFDLVHAFEARPTVLLPALYMQDRQKTPLVMDWCDWFGRGGSVEERPNWLVRTLLRPVETFFEEHFRTRAIGTTVICSTLYQKAIELGVPSETILRLRDGADVEGLQPLPLKKCRSQLGLSNDLLLIGYVGAIFRRDAWLMAQAFDLIYAQQPQARLLLIGYVNQPLEQMVNAPHAVIRSGVLDYSQLNTYIAACNVCWLPYCDSGANQGRWPLKLNDYMAVGRATIATAVGDVTEVMQTHDIGVLVEVSAEELAFKTLDLLDAPEECEHLGQNARVVAEKFFDWRLRVSQLEAFYEHILVECES